MEDRQVEPKGEVLWDLIAPVTLTELQATLRNTKKGALGTDNVTLADLRKLDPRALLAHMNLWLYTCYLPAGLRSSRTVLIPKIPAPTGPKDYRPISIGPYMARVFHRLLATQLSNRIKFQSRQRAFTKGDGIADNVFLLRCLLRDSCVELKPLSLVFLDVSKAFDSVSHASLFLAAKRMGVPGPFVEYLRCLYSEAATRLQVGEKLSVPLAQNRGVKQGDPLSPILFNCIIDWAIEALDLEIGVRVGDDGPRLNHLAFADDIVLMARSKIGIQHLSQQLEGALGHCGLTLNPDKSRSLTIAVDGKAGRWVCDPTPYVSLAGGTLPSIPISEGYKYLGITVSSREGGSSAEELLTRGLNHLTKAPLKPQQRLYLLKHHLIPKLHHRLILSRSNNGVLRRLDKLVRRSLRSWLRLPHDAVNALFHSEVREGGLGIPSLKLTIPLLKKARLDRLARVLDPVISALVANSRTFADERRRCTNPPPKVGDNVVRSMVDAKRELAASLHGAVDGCGLRASRAVPYVHDWVTNGTALLTGANYIHAIQIRSGTVATRQRAARGRPDADRRCDACWRIESLGHVLQVCPRTWGHRIKRHDALLEKFLLKMENRGWAVTRAPVITVRGGSPQIPDAVLYSRSTCWVVDASVVADNADLDNAHVSKCVKYDTPPVRDWCQSNWPSEGVSGDIFFGALIFNWRGAMSQKSASMCRTFGISKSELVVFSAAICEWGWKVYRAFHKTTA